MRIYNDAVEMAKEVERDLWEMGIRVQPETMQDKIVKDDPSFNTIELFGYGYMLTDTERSLDAMLDHFGANKTWATWDFAERVNPFRINPGKAYKMRDTTWAPFLRDGTFAYTYNERLREQIPYILDELVKRPNSRQAVITIYDRHQDMNNMGGKDRVPCSMHYQFAKRGDALHCVYVMRSCDLLEHFPYDVYMACRLNAFLAASLGLKPGMLTHFVGSLHGYQKDFAKRKIF